MTGQPIPLDSFETFGDLLKYLRRREHLTQLEFSILVGYSDAQITRLEKNQRRPDIAALKALFIPALHIEDEPKIVAHFLELAESARAEDAPAPGVPPYKGLLFFDESDADLFFGREALTTHLARRVADLTNDSYLRFLAVVGASGSGKSSLVRAGLSVALKKAGWDVRVFTPGTSPVKVLEAQLEEDRGRADLLLLIVDQFEETFTLCHTESERVLFIEKLLRLVQEPSRKIAVVIALRADFYPHCAQYPGLRQAVAAGQEYIGQMTAEELRRAIEEPAKRCGWELEPGLVDVLLQDIGANASHELEPGALPLLSHGLLATWERRRGHTFTLEGYHASGGVRGAIAETAESVFNDQLNQMQQELARDVFLRLTELGDGTEDTRRRAALSELVQQPSEATQLRTVLNMLAEARLITLSEDSAEVAHEALIREWQRLHEWLTQDREGLMLHRHLTESADEWEARGRDPAELYRGARLAQAREWASAHEGRLNAQEKAFLAASIGQEQHDALEREAQRQRELEAAQKLAETERARAEEQTQSANRLRMRNRLITIAGSAVVILALVAGAFGLQSSRNSGAAQRNAAAALSAQGTAQAASTQAIADFTQSEAQRLAVEANNLTLSNEDPNLVALLAIRSLHMQYTPAGDAALTNLTNLSAPPRELKGHMDGVWSVAISPDGKYLATASQDKTARLWDLATGQSLRVLSGHTAGIGGIAFSPDGKYLMTGSDDRTARLWDVATGQTLQEFPGQIAENYGLTFAPDGKNVITTGPGFARVWEAATGKTVHILSQDARITYYQSAYSPDGKYILTGCSDSNAILWDAATGEQVRAFNVSTPVGGVAFSPDGRTIATGSDDTIVRLWDVATGQMLREFSGHEQPIENVQFSPDGQFLLTGSDDRTARLWDIATGKELRSFRGQRDFVTGAVFSPDGGTIVTSAFHDPVVRVWGLRTPLGGMEFYEPGGYLSEASFSPDGKQVVTASDNNTAHIWDAATGQLLVALTGHSDKIRGAVFSPNGKMVLTTSADKTARLWDAASGKELMRFDGHTDAVNRGVFSPDGKTIVTTSYDGTARVWDIQTAKTILVHTNQGPDRLNRVAFAPDGKTVVTSGDDGTARIWDPSTGKELIVFKAPGSVAGVAFSPDGKYLAGASADGSVMLWDVTTGKELRRFSGHPGGAYAVAFSPDGKFLLSGGMDKIARLWDVQTGQEARRFTGHSDGLRNVTFSPDGKYILTSSQDGTARLWLTDLDDTIRAVCSALTRDLTPDERVQFGIHDQGPTCPAT